MQTKKGEDLEADPDSWLVDKNLRTKVYIHVYIAC